VSPSRPDQPAPVRRPGRRAERRRVVGAALGLLPVERPKLQITPLPMQRHHPPRGVPAEEQRRPLGQDDLVALRLQDPQGVAGAGARPGSAQGEQRSGVQPAQQRRLFPLPLSPHPADGRALGQELQPDHPRGRRLRVQDLENRQALSVRRPGGEPVSPAALGRRSRVLGQGLAAQAALIRQIQVSISPHDDDTAHPPPQDARHGIIGQLETGGGRAGCREADQEENHPPPTLLAHLLSPGPFVKILRRFFHALPGCFPRTGRAPTEKTNLRKAIRAFPAPSRDLS